MVLGSINEIVVDLTEPMEIKMQTLTYRQINLFAGQNGSGKSFLLIKVFCLQTALGVYAALPIDQVIPDVLKRKVAQEIWDGSFTDQNLNGTIEGRYDHGVSLKVTFVKGDVTDVQYSDLTKITAVAPVIYMSSHMRTFESIKMYLKMRKIFKESSQPTHEFGADLATKLVKDGFKLYDILCIERLISKMPILDTVEICKTLSNFEPNDQVFNDIASFDVDYDRCDFLYRSKATGNAVYLTSLPKGHQSLINMVLCSIP